MATWRRTKPDDSTAVRDADDYIRDNWAVLEDAINRDHKFAGDGGATEGYHMRGVMAVLFQGAASLTRALSTGPGFEGSGCMVYDTTTHRFKWWDGSIYQNFDHLQASGDTLSAAWTIPGSYVDGRDPSVDGAKLDTMSASGQSVKSIPIAKSNHGDTVNIPGGYTRAQCHIFLNNCGDFSTGGYAIQALSCSAVSVAGGWRLHSVVRANDTDQQVPVWGFIIAIK